MIRLPADHPLLRFSRTALIAAGVGAALCLVSFVITLMTPEPREWLARHRRPN